MIELQVQSKFRTEFIAITGEIQRTVRDRGWKDGILTLFVPHTTAGLTIQENADPDVVNDMIYALEKAVPWHDPKYSHAEGNTAAHVKAAMVGASTQCFIEDGKLLLGRWQGLFFCEFHGPRSRHLWLTFQPAQPS